MLAQIRADELDAIFTAVDPDALGDDFAATQLPEEEFVCTLAVGHPPAARDHVTFQQLAGPRSRDLPRELGDTPALRADAGRPHRRARGRSAEHRPAVAPRGRGCSAGQTASRT